MSIMCTCFVPDGIVMAADSRQTIGFTAVRNQPNANTGEPHVLNRMNQPNQPPMQMLAQSDNAQKIILLHKVRVGISACGIGILKGKTVSDFIRSFEIDRIVPEDTVTDVANKLHDYAFEFFPQVNFFVCGYEEEEPFVYTVNKEIRRNNMDKGNLRYASSWSGEQAAISKLLNGNPPMLVNHLLMPLKDAIDFAEFLVDVTIKSQRFEMKVATCGGQIDILVLTMDESFWYRHKIFKPDR